MARYDEDWCEALGLAAGKGAGIALVEPVRILYVVTNTDEGKVAFRIEMDEGSVAVATGKFPRGVTPDVTITATESVLIDLWSGARTRDQAFMAGDVKIEGAYAMWLDELAPAFAGPPWQHAWASAV